MSTLHRLGGLIHTYQRYDPVHLPSPRRAAPDLVSGAFDHLFMFGSLRELTDEELMRAVHLEPSQIRGLGPSLDALIAMLEERKRKIIATWETEKVRERARDAYRALADAARPPDHLARFLAREIGAEHLRGLEQLWYHAERDDPGFAAQLASLIERLGEKYQVDELAAKYAFAGRKPLEVEEAILLKQELETIDELLRQLREAMKTAQIGVIDMEALARFAEPGDLEQLGALREQIEELLREAARQQGLEHGRDGYTLTPKAMRLYQSRLLEAIFNDLQSARTGRHEGCLGDGAVEIPRSRPYEFGDSLAHIDVVQTLTNAMIREALAGTREAGGGVRLRPGDIEVHETRHTPKCATAVVMDMSGSMRRGGLYVACKRMSLALDGLIRREYPGDSLDFVEMYTFAKRRHVSELPALMPKLVTLYDPVVRLKADMSDPRITEMDVPPHFTNIQHGLRLARQLLAVQPTPNRQIVLITDGLPTAHFEGETVYLLYPPNSRTEKATMREASLCAREGITINVFLLPSWSQSEEDVHFAQRMVQATQGRVFFTGGRDLDRFVLWDYVKRRRSIIA